MPGAGGGHCAQGPVRRGGQASRGEAPAEAGSGFPSAAGEPRPCLGRVAGGIVPVFGERGSQPVKGNSSLGTGGAAAKLGPTAGCGCLRERKGGNERLFTLSPKLRRMLTRTGMIYRSHLAFRGINSQDVAIPPLRLAPADPTACRLRCGRRALSFYNLTLKPLQVILDGPEPGKLPLGY